MSRSTDRRLFALAFALALPASSIAQHRHGADTAAAPSPAASAAAQRQARPEARPAPRELYRSAFDGYPPFNDPPAVSWREANDTVGRIGGWRAYAREAQGAPAQPASPAASQPASAAAPRAGGAHQH